MSGKRSTPVTEQDRKGTLDPARDGEIEMAVAVEIGHERRMRTIADPY